MTWEYLLIALIVGFIIGVLLIRFGNTKIRNQQALQTELEKKTHELEEYHKELIKHFARSAELFDNMAKDYRQLYQHMPKSFHELISDIPIKNNSFKYRLTELDNDQSFINSQPKDYSEGSSGLFRSI
ncbi:MAG: Z-ring associated protein ZapG [Arsenophonus sp.]